MKLSFLFLFLLGNVPQARSAAVSRPGVSARGAVSSGAFIERYYPGWGKPMQKLLRSPEGRVMAQFEKDFGLVGRADSPVMEVINGFVREGRKPQDIGDFNGRMRETVANKFMSTFVPRQAEDLASRADDISLGKKALSETLAQMSRLSQVYGLSLDTESAQFKHFNSSYRAAEKRLGKMRMGAAKGVASGAQAWVAQDYDHVPPSPSAAAPSRQGDWLRGRSRYVETWILKSGQPKDGSAGIDRPSLKLGWANHKVSNVNGEASVSLDTAFKHNTGAVLFKVPAAGSGEKATVEFVRGFKSRGRYEVTQARAGRIAKLLGLLKEEAAKKDKSVGKDENLKLTIEAFEAQAKAPAAGKSAMPTPKWLTLALALLAGASVKASAATGGAITPEMAWKGFSTAMGVIFSAVLIVPAVFFLRRLISRFDGFGPLSLAAFVLGLSIPVGAGWLLSAALGVAPTSAYGAGAFLGALASVPVLRGLVRGEFGGGGFFPSMSLTGAAMALLSGLVVSAAISAWAVVSHIHISIL